MWMGRACFNCGTWVPQCARAVCMRALGQEESMRIQYALTFLQSFSEARPLCSRRSVSQLWDIHSVASAQAEFWFNLVLTPVCLARTHARNHWVTCFSGCFKRKEQNDFVLIIRSHGSYGCGSTGWCAKFWWQRNLSNSSTKVFEKSIWLADSTRFPRWFRIQHPFPDPEETAKHIKTLEDLESVA